MIGQRINNYEIVEQIGEGGMGAVYMARHPFIDRKVAVKVLRASLANDPDVVQRFFNEAKAANAIRHPNIIDILDVGLLPDGRTPYLMMELLNGENVSQRLKRNGIMAVAEAVTIAIQTADAVTAAHTQGIVHRDLKPENLFLVRDRNGDEVVKVLDFGIAKLRGSLSGNAVRTQTGALMGTPPYMSPEQCRGVSGEVDHRTDVYALGIILYEMLCGAPPFLGEGFGDVLVQHLTKAPDPPRSRNPGIPASLERVILRALAKTVGQRFASMAELQRALEGKPVAEPEVLEVAALPPTTLLPITAAPSIAPTPPGFFQRPTTTLSATAGEVESFDGDTLPRGRRGWLLGGVAVAGAAALALFFGLRSPSPPLEKSAAAVGEPKIAAVTPPPPAAKLDAGAAPATTVVAQPAVTTPVAATTKKPATPPARKPGAAKPPRHLPPAAQQPSMDKW